MPLEIKELHIKVTVNQPRQSTGSSAVAPSLSTAKAEDDKEALVSQCVEAVMEIIHHKKER